MYSLPKYNNNHRSHYYSLAQQFQPKRYHYSLSTNINLNPSYTSNYQQQQFTFNKNFSTNQHLNSAHVQKRYHPKYRSASLPSECIVRNLSRNHFSYYDQLKRRNYITSNNCQYYQKNKYQPLFNKEKCLSYSSMNDLNRFYKYDSSKRIEKNFNGPIVQTKVKIYDKYDKNNRFTQIKSNFQPQFCTMNKIQREINQRPGQVPIIDCSIEVKSDDEGRFYSTVQSHFPTILTDQKTLYDQQQKIITTQATLVRDYSQSFDYLPMRTQSNHDIVPQNHINLKDIDKEKFIKNQQCQTYVIKKKKPESKRQIVDTSNENDQQKYLKSKNSNRQKPKKQQIKIVKSPIKQKVLLQYLSESKQLKNPTSNKKNISSVKIKTQNESQKYTYSKYFIAEMQAKKQQKSKSKSKSIRKQELSDRKNKTKKSLSKIDQNIKTVKKVTDAHSPRAKKVNQKKIKYYLTNYASTHLLTTKK